MGGTGIDWNSSNVLSLPPRHPRLAVTNRYSQALFGSFVTTGLPPASLCSDRRSGLPEIGKHVLVVRRNSCDMTVFFSRVIADLPVCRLASKPHQRETRTGFRFRPGDRTHPQLYSGQQRGLKIMRRS